jgi:hypothetical protein
LEISTNDIGSVYNVTGITVAKAEKNSLSFRSVYPAESSNYANARTRTVFNQQLTYMELDLLSNCYYKRILCCRVSAAYAGTADTTCTVYTCKQLHQEQLQHQQTYLGRSATDNVAVTGYNVYRVPAIATVTGTALLPLQD